MDAKTWKTLQAEAAECLERGEVGKAAEALIDAIELAPREAHLYEQLIRVTLLAGSTQTAVSAAVELRRLDGENAQYAYLHAVASLAHGDVDGAQTVLEEALRFAPDSWELRQALAQTWRAKKQDGKALALLEEAVRRAPDAPGPVNDYATLLIERGQVADARIALERAERSHPDDGGLQLTLALACVKLGEREAAKVHAQNASRVEDADVKAQAVQILAMLSR